MPRKSGRSSVFLLHLGLRRDMAKFTCTQADEESSRLKIVNQYLGSDPRHVHMILDADSAKRRAYC